MKRGGVKNGVKLNSRFSEYYADLRIYTYAILGVLAVIRR